MTTNYIDYSKEDEHMRRCTHGEYLALCVYCGKPIHVPDWMISMYVGRTVEEGEVPYPQTATGATPAATHRVYAEFEL